MVDTDVDTDRRGLQTPPDEGGTRMSRLLFWDFWDRLMTFLIDIYGLLDYIMVYWTI